MDAVLSVAWSSDGSVLATGSSDSMICLWDPKMGKIIKMLKGTADAVKKVTFFDGDQQL